MTREEARERAQQLVDQMTLEEKASQLRFDADAIERLNVPEYNWWNEALHGVARAGTATVFPQSIGLGATFDEDLLEQIGDAVATEGRAKYNEQAKREDRDIYKGLTFWAPNVNIFRDPRWGRGHETYGEDPYLTSRMGVRYVKGLQGDGPYLKSAACAKHFAVHSGPEAERHHFNAIASKKDMEETYLPAFEACVKEGKVEAVMGAYNRTNGEPCCANSVLMDYLRGKWGFEGHFVSDCWAVRDFHEEHKVTSRPEESVKMALEAGCDVNCGCTYQRIINAYEEGLLDEKYITQSAVRLFTTRYLLGLFDETEFDSIPYTEVEAPAHLALAHKAALESIVLLKNDGILPLDASKIGTIGVIGPNADSRSALIGNYHGTSSQYITVLEGIRAVAGENVRILYSEGSHLWAKNMENLSKPEGGDRLSEADIVCEYSDVVILVVGLDETLEGEEGDTGNSAASGDKADLLLPLAQRKLMSQVLSCGKPVIVLNMTGSAMDLREADEKASAVVQTWYPGARGGLDVAKILFGEEAPSGKLPLTFYESTEDLPEFTDYSMKGRTYRYYEGRTLYPFGYGLTYSDTEATDVKVIEVNAAAGAGITDAVAGTAGADAVAGTAGADAVAGAAGADAVAGTAGADAVAGAAGADEAANTAGADADGFVAVEITARNLGQRAVEDVLQVYVHDDTYALAVPNAQLSWFGRICLEAGETKTVTAKIPARAFTSVDENGERALRGGTFTISAGFSQPDARSQELTGHACVKTQVTID